jgi:hypothetical protein
MRHERQSRGAAGRGLISIAAISNNLNMRSPNKTGGWCFSRRFFDFG